jgi:ribosome-associated protein
MRGRDEDSGDYLGPSRSEQRRAALDVLALGEKLVALSEAQLAKLPNP